MAEGSIVPYYWRVNGRRFHFNTMIVTVNNTREILYDRALVMTYLTIITYILKCIESNGKGLANCYLQRDTCSFWSEIY